MRVAARSPATRQQFLLQLQQVVRQMVFKRSGWPAAALAPGGLALCQQQVRPVTDVYK
ncbi:MAG: hypothetical protein KJ914_05395 [Gammaproteobacteria bacterium]|nr:hypothetical protein [Gammaproteobacteria bacterium]MBU1723275.1 hypothetical protein [Gammaproteobacteria bacterium]MBU2006570.1 hypothetical protein [Gammaproteobacteria bacterium]